MAMTLVSTVTVGAGGAASIEFTNIPQTGKDLLLVASARKTTATQGSSYVELNGSTTGYTTRYLRGNGATVSSATSSAAGFYVDRWIPGSDWTASTFGNAAIYISNYTSSAAKSASIDSVSEQNTTTSYQTIHAASWTGTNPITSISFDISADNYAQYSTASLYIIS